MSIRDENKAAEARERRDKEVAARHAREAEARPDTLHRAVVFLLKEQAVNNRDTKTEASYFIRMLDEEKANPAKLQEVLKEVEAPAAEHPANPTAEKGTADEAVPNPVAATKRSRRFTART